MLRLLTLSQKLTRHMYKTTQLGMLRTSLTLRFLQGYLVFNQLFLFSSSDQKLSIEGATQVAVTLIVVWIG
jgi:hypothetical protein